MPAFLRCGLCEEYAVDGFLSRLAWGHLEQNPHGKPLQACPFCVERYPDWQDRLLATVEAPGPVSDRYREERQRARAEESDEGHRARPPFGRYV